MFLTPDELAELTHRKRADAQAKALRYMGLEFKTRPDGSLAVLRSHVERMFGGEEYNHQPEPVFTINL